MYRQRAKRGQKLERTQISLTKEDRELLQRVADRERVSMSEVVREAVRKYCAGNNSVKSWPDIDYENDTRDPWDRLMDIVGTMDSGDPRSSVDHDKIIYD